MLDKTDHDLFLKEADRFTCYDRDAFWSWHLIEVASEKKIHTHHRGVRLLRTKKLPIMDEQGRPRFLLAIAEDTSTTLQNSAATRPHCVFIRHCGGPR